MIDHHDHAFTFILNEGRSRPWCSTCGCFADQMNNAAPRGADNSKPERTPMARTSTPEPEQLDLIDCKPENAKKIERAIRDRNSLKAQIKDARDKFNDKEVAIVDLMKEAGARPDVNGVLALKVGEKLLKVKPGKAQLNIQEENEDQSGDTEEAADDLDFDGNEPELVERKKK